MAFLFLTNLAGYTASSIDAAGLTAGTASGYSVNDFIQGPRSTRHRTTDSTSEIGRGYVFAANTTCDYIFISRADWLITKNGSRVRPRQRSSGAVWSYITGVDLNPISTANLVGVSSQDYVAAISPTDLRGVGLSVLPSSGSQATQISKFWGCQSFSLDREPALEMSWQPLPEYSFATPLNGTLPYEIERRFTIQFQLVTRAKAVAFRALPHIFEWPLVLYDSNGDNWTHKVEHVIIESMNEVILQNDKHNITLTCARLKHYD